MRNVLMAMVISVAASPVLAGDVWECSFPENRMGSGGWAEGPVVVQIPKGGSEAVVNSAVIMHFIGKPISAAVSVNKPEQVLVKWDVKTNVKGVGNHQYTTTAYRLNILQGGAKAIYSAQPLAYDNTWRNEGKCRKGKG